MNVLEMKYVVSYKQSYIYATKREDFLIMFKGRSACKNSFKKTSTKKLDRCVMGICFKKNVK